MTAVPGGTRQTSASVIFRHPFHVGADTRELPPGTYSIETREDEYRSGSGSVFVAVSVDLVVRERGRTTARIVSPSDLRQALDRDRDRSDGADEGAGNRS